MKINIGTQYTVVNINNEIITRAGKSIVFQKLQHAKEFAEKGHGRYRVLTVEFKEMEVTHSDFRT